MHFNFRPFSSYKAMVRQVKKLKIIIIRSQIIVDRILLVLHREAPYR